MITRIVIQLGFTRHLILLVIVTNTLKFSKLIHYNDILYLKYQISNLTYIAICLGKKKVSNVKSKSSILYCLLKSIFFL